MKLGYLNVWTKENTFLIIFYICLLSDMTNASSTISPALSVLFIWSNVLIEYYHTNEHKNEYTSEYNYMLPGPNGIKHPSK